MGLGFDTACIWGLASDWAADFGGTSQCAKPENTIIVMTANVRPRADTRTIMAMVLSCYGSLSTARCSAERNLRRYGWLVADYGDSIAVGQFDHFGFFEDDGFSEFEDNAGGAGGVEFVDGGGSDRGDVQPHVLIFVGDFDAGPAAGFAEGAGAFDHGIGAFEGFDGDDLTIEHGDGLADIHAADGDALLPAVADVVPLFGGGLA